MGNRIKYIKFIEDIRENKDIYTIEQMANYILSYTGKTQVPIDIFGVMRHIGFEGLGADFKSDTVVGIVSNEKDLKVKNMKVSNYIAVKIEVDTNQRRYLVSWCLSEFIINARLEEDFIKAYNNSYIQENVKTKVGLLARALLMPQNELSVFINSPIMKNQNKQQIISKVAKAFLLNEEIAALRLEDIGYIL